MNRVRRGDERGSTLMLVLVFITIVGVSGAAVLNLQSTTYRAQGIVTGKATTDQSAQNALNSAIQVLRADPSGETGRDDTTKTAGCNNKNSSSTVVDYGSGSGAMQVQCTPMAGSGQRPNGDAELPKAVIVTMGGAEGNGPNNGDTNTAQIPFCDDFHARDSGSCEAGFFLGRADPTINSEGGLIVDSNGGNGTYLMKSNSSIVVRDGGDSDRKIKVDGKVWARRACSAQVVANYTSSNSNDYKTDCGGKDNVDNATWPLMTMDDCSGGRVPDESCFPYLPRQGDTAHPGANSATPDGLWDLRTFTEPTEFTTADASNPFNPSAKPAPRMTATPVPGCPGVGGAGYVIFTPGYYNDLDALDDRMNNCGDTLFYFKPGPYYFDFSPSSTQNSWTEPNGANGKLSQIVGGTGTTSGDGAWLPCNIDQNKFGPSSPTYDPRLPADVAHNDCPVQPTKHMDLQLLSTSSQWANPVDTLKMDTTSDSATTNNTAAFIKWSKPQVRLPERTGTAVKSLAVRIKYLSPSTNPDGSPQYAPGWPRLTVQLPGGANCDFYLTKYGNTLPSPDGDKFTLFTTDAQGNFKVGDACNSKTNGWDAKLASVPADPSLVNGMTLIYEVKSTKFQQYVQGSVDGVNIDVDYKGRPAPDYPGGCDPRQPGVQFVFGGNSRMNFNANNAFVELCGFRSTTPDNVTTLPTTSGGGKYAIAMYGVPEFAADPPRRSTTIAQFTDINNGNNKKFPLQSVVADGTPGMVDAADAVDTSAAKICATGCAQDNVLKSAQWSDNTAANIQFNTQLKSNGTIDQIPAGSTITGTELRFRHAEGKVPLDANGVSPDTSAIGAIKITVTPGTSGGGSNGAIATSFAINNVPHCGDFKMPKSNPACDFHFGFFGETPNNASPASAISSPAGTRFTSKSNPCWADNTTSTLKSGATIASFNSQFTTTGYTAAKCDWYGGIDNRALVDSLSTPEAWNGAQVQVSYIGNAGSTNKMAWVDGVELTVYYRPPGTVRPLSGCLTTRAGHNPYANAEWNNTATSPATRLVGVDTDWGARTQTVGLSDSAYTSGTATTDVESCALIRMLSSQTSGVKLHVRGMIYAPTAALDLNGKDNEAPFVTDGIIARHITTWRWRTGHPTNAFGQDIGDRNDRQVWLYVKQNGTTIARELVDIDDGEGSSFGRNAAVNEFTLRPVNQDSRCRC
jgi:hypothetical protein